MPSDIQVEAICIENNCGAILIHRHGYSYKIDQQIDQQIGGCAWDGNRYTYMRFDNE